MTHAGLLGIASRTRLELRYPAEFYWLLGLVFFLPLFEAPKNICWLAYVLTWLYNRARAREWGGRWNAWDSLFAVWIASGYLVAAFAGIHHDEWGAANDIVRYGSVVWLTARSRYGERALLVILGTAIASTLLTLAWACWELVAKTKIYLELNSVGYYNHSAVYLAIVFGIALSLALAYGSRVGMTGRILLHLTALVLAASVLLTGSRGGVATAALLALALVPIYFFRTGRRVAVPIACVVSVAALLLAAIPGSVRRTEAIVESGQPPGQPLSYRREIWSNGLVEWRRFPLFGVGMGNFGHVGRERLQAWSQDQNWVIRASAAPIAVKAPHGHSLYINTLAERGLFGFGVVVLVLLAWGRFLVVSVPGADGSPIEWAVFGSAFSGWFVTGTAGLINTTLHHEHGILSVLLLGLWLGFRRAGDADSNPSDR